MKDSLTIYGFFIFLFIYEFYTASIRYLITYFALSDIYASKTDNKNIIRASKSPDFSGDLPIFDKIMKISRSPDFE